MRRTTIGFAALTLAFFGSLITPTEARAVSRCTLSVNVNLMPRPADTDGVPVVDCQGRRAGPQDGLYPNDLIPEFDIDLNLVS
jgi:hypothetical protein